MEKEKEPIFVKNNMIDLIPIAKKLKEKELKNSQKGEKIIRNYELMAMKFQRKKDIEDFEKMIDGDKIYPKDIFPEVSKEELRLINEYCQEVLKFPLDRLSAHISRKLLKGIKQQLQEIKEKK